MEILAHIPAVTIHLSSWRGLEQPLVSIRIEDIQAECYVRKNQVIEVRKLEKKIILFSTTII